MIAMARVYMTRDELPGGEGLSPAVHLWHRIPLRVDMGDHSVWMARKENREGWIEGLWIETALYRYGVIPDNVRQVIRIGRPDA